jgi:uncharacterized protein YjbJ (UPF0337 family)
MRRSRADWAVADADTDGPTEATEAISAAISPGDRCTGPTAAGGDGHAGGVWHRPAGQSRARTTRYLEDGIGMGTDDKARNKAEELKGKAKEELGRATDDEELEAEGRTDQASSDLKQAGEKVKDAFKR